MSDERDNPPNRHLNYYNRRLLPSVKMQGVKQFSLKILPVGGALCLALLSASSVSAANIYTVNSWIPADNEVNVTGLKYVGFKFSVSSNTWIDSLSAWVGAATFTGLHTVSLFDITTPSSPSLERSITISGGLTAGADKNCTYANYFCSIGVNDFQLVTGKIYSLSASYRDLLNAQTYITNLTTTGQDPQVTVNSVFTNLGNTISTASENPPLGTSTLGETNFGNAGPNLGLGGGPLPPSSPVPAPLPLFGASAALVYSRRIKARIKLSAN
jgi:hypothetical protein